MSYWDVVQQLQIQNLQSRAILNDTQQELHHAQGRNRDQDLADGIARMALVMEAMWSLLSERLGVTEQELIDRIHAIDMADGVRDGRHSPPPRRCPSCQAAVPADRPTCQFCGTATPGGHTFGV